MTPVQAALASAMTRAGLGHSQAQDLWMDWNERAAICEHCGEMPRDEAERFAAERVAKAAGLELTLTRSTP